MTSREATRSHGSRCRQQNDREIHHVREHDTAPEWGNRFACVACWQHGLTDLTRHRNQHCPDWNAFNRINCGFHRQWQMGFAPIDANGNCPHSPFVLTGEHCRLVKGRFSLLPHHIMRWQSEDCGPCDPLETPPGVVTAWQGLTHHQLLQVALASLPPSVAAVPKKCTCTRALARSLNGTTSSCFHEKNALDELVCQKAVGDFMGAHPPLAGAHQNQFGGHWHNTQPFLARNSMMPLNGVGDWVDLAPANQGVCGVGDHGIAESAAMHYTATMNAAAAGGIPNGQAHLYQGKNIHHARRGQFTMPGTPRR